MEAIGILLALGLAFVAFILPIVAFVIARNARAANEHLDRELGELRSELATLRRELRELNRQPRAPRSDEDGTTAAKSAAAPAATAPAPTVVAPVPPPVVAPVVAPSSPETLVPPPLAAAPVSRPALPPATAAATPPPLPPRAPDVVLRPASPPPIDPPPPPAPAAEPFNWEQFFGVKLFAWLGGVALALGAAYFLKLSIEQGWISPEMRVALGFVFGAGLIVGGLEARRRNYATTGHALAATGILTLYAVTFACRALYHFPFFQVLPTFALMTLITVTAFLLAVRLPAQVVAVLGLLGGFLTPVLLSTGVDNPGGLFGYIALLDLGLIAVALYRNWSHLVPLAAAGTAALQIGWADKFFAVEKLPIAVAVGVGFVALFTAAVAVARRFDRASDWVAGSVLIPATVAAGFSCYFTSLPAVAAQPAWVFGNLLAADLGVLAMAALHRPLARAHLAGALGAFGVTALWIGQAATPSLLPWALCFVVLLGAVHAAFPLLLGRLHPEAEDRSWLGLFPLLGMLVFFVPVLTMHDAGFWLWPAILALNLLAVVAAALSGVLAALAGAIALTFILLGLAIVRLPLQGEAGLVQLGLIAGFALLFCAASVWLLRRFGRTEDDDGGGEPAWLAHLPALSAATPFVLVTMLALKLRLPDPGALFGVTLLLAVLLGGLAVIARQGLLALAALLGCLLVEYSWHAESFAAGAQGTALAWYTGFALLFTAFPFVFRERLLALQPPWAGAALALPLHFLLLHRAIGAVWPNDVPGIFALACAAPPLLGLIVLLRTIPAGAEYRLNRLAWFGAATLFFVTLVFPLQFSRHWITVGWALEGAALLWLFHRIPHPGLRLTGVALLVAVFARLVVNPAVFDYGARGEAPILNWMLYTYGIAALACFAGARLLAPPRDRVIGINAPALLATLGTILAFALVNLEIADYFTPAGARLRFEFSGNFARDMSYTIAWAVFALALLVAGILRRLPAARWAAIVLLGAALLKLFLHDLATLQTMYRVAALMAVAAIAIAASFLYQRFLRSTQAPRP